MDREEMKVKIRNIRNLPTLSTVANQIKRVTSESESSAQDLANAVVIDQSLSAKILNLANSAFFGFSHHIATIPQAVVVIGFDEVKNLALGVSVYETLSPSADEVSFDRKAFWMHTVGCATACKLIARELGYRDPGIFMAGLLHDLGKVVLDRYFHEQYQKVVQILVKERRPAMDVEMEVLNINHAEVGGWLAFRWKFPEVLVASIENHHDLVSSNEEYLKEALIVHLANVLTKRAGIGLCYETPFPEPNPMVQTHLHLSPEIVTSITDELQDHRDGISEFFGHMRE